MFSLVTACMNREGHLRRALPQWLRLPGLADLVIVDWSNHSSLSDLVDLDPRIRLFRVEDEPKWILSYAYNFGVAQTTCEQVLKCDADCLPEAAVARCAPTDRAFFAGHWRSGRPIGKASVNGQCFFSRTLFEKVNGYSELIRVYGRDDEDFYDRLIAAGCERLEILPEHLNFIDHTQEDRIAHQIDLGAPGSVEDFLNRQLPYHEMMNLFISQFLPWGPWYERARYLPVKSTGRLATFKRDTSREIPLSAPLLQQARLHGLRAVVAQFLSLSPAAAARLDPDQCLAVLKQRMTARAAGQTGAPQTAIA